MKDVRIVVVSWNVRELLGRCLASLPGACEGLDWDVCLVDNASDDGSADIAEQQGSAGRMQVIRNRTNRGFAKACNQGIATSESRYVLLLNPDTECPPGSITKFVRRADQYPQVGIFGPAVTNADGSPQQSVRSFPGFLDQAGILLKLHHVFPGWARFQKYFYPKTAGDPPESPLGKGGVLVDQVMGAAFLIRRELIEDIGGLDERYFIWFEEVDYCRAAHRRGWPTAYVPQASVIHHGGRSFAQVMGVDKQRMFADSMAAYFRKWHPGWRAKANTLLGYVSIALAWAIQTVRTHPWTGWMAGIAAFEIISRLTVFHPYPRAVVTILAGGAMALLAMRKPHLGLVLLLTELMVGSKGALLKIPNGFEVDGGISLRIVLTACFLAGWLVQSIPAKAGNQGFKRWILDQVQDGQRKAWLALYILVAYAAVRGYLLGNGAFFRDVNAWLFLILLVPVVEVSGRYGSRMIDAGKNAVIAALLWLPLKTLALLYVFSHGIKSMSQPLYLWVRRTGVGEVTLVTGNLFRIFIQSQVYAIFGILFAGARYLAGLRFKVSGSVFWIMTASAVSILISLSRSFWLGLCFGLITLCVLCIRGRIREVPRLVLIGIGSVLLALSLLAVTVAFPYPHVDVGSLSTLFGSRGSTTDAAAESRWNLLPVLTDKIKEAPILGHGFGATVTYQTKDPRILAQNPEGWYTTHAFEWGWLEHWIKFGIFGIPIMLWVLTSLAWRFWSLDEEWWVRAGFVSSVAALAALHVFTPYLNHPLGFGFLFAAEGYIEARNASRRVISTHSREQNPRRT